MWISAGSLPVLPVLTRCAIREEIARLISGCSWILWIRYEGSRGTVERCDPFCCSSTSQNRRGSMCAMELTDGNDQQPARSAARRRVPVIWLWMIVVAAWTLALLSVLTNQSYLINHHYLLEESHLPVLVALVVFLAGFQVMTVGMMLPSSMPMLSMMVHASRKPGRPRTSQLSFLPGYPLSWTGFAAAAFLGDTAFNQLVHRWLCLYLHSWVTVAATLALAGGLLISPLQGTPPTQQPSPFHFF